MRKGNLPKKKTLKALDLESKNSCILKIVRISQLINT